MKKMSEVIGDYSMKGSRRNDAPGNVRAGMNVVGSRRNVLSDEEEENQTPASVCVIVKRPDGKVLAVSRNADNNDLNLPGGSMEFGETPEEAARRELWEETGMIATELVEVHRGMARTKMAIVFKAKDASGKIRDSLEGKTCWVEPRRMLTGTFGNFLAKLIRLGYV